MRRFLGRWKLMHEAVRHLFRRPLVGVAAFAHTKDGRVLLIRRGDTGTWAFPGGLLDWGESLREALIREVREEAGAETIDMGRVIGAFSRPGRDPRMHSVTIVVDCTVADPTRGPDNPAEIREVGLFLPGAIPRPLAFESDDILALALAGERGVLE